MLNTKCVDLIGGGEPAKKQPKLGLLTTQRKSDVLILINFISIFHIAESIFNHESLLDDYTNCVSEGTNTHILICMVVT